MNGKKLIQQLAGTDYRVRVLYNKLVSELAKIGNSIDDIPEDRLSKADSATSHRLKESRLYAKSNSMQTITKLYHEYISSGFTLPSYFATSQTVSTTAILTDFRSKHNWHS